MRRVLSLIGYSAMILIAAAMAWAKPCLTIRNNHDLPYMGPVVFTTKAPDGIYAGTGMAQSMVRDGVARSLISLAPHSQITLAAADQQNSSPAGSMLTAKIVCRDSDVSLSGSDLPFGTLEFGLVSIPGRKTTVNDAVAGFQPLSIRLKPALDTGIYTGTATSGDYVVEISISPSGIGAPESGIAFFDVRAKVTRTKDTNESEYLALVRKITPAGVQSPRMRVNGSVLDSLEDKTSYDRDFTMGQGTDWCSWGAGKLRYLVVNGFSGGYTREAASTPGRWVSANHFYTWEKVAQRENSLYFVSEIAGPNPEQEKARYAGATPYVAPRKDEPVSLHWRLAVTQAPVENWEEAQFLVFSGYQHVSDSGETATVDLGVPGVEFGTAYFPYSTMCENFDYCRTPGLDREGWWPFSPTMWENWRAFAPQMKTDLRILRGMGMDWVRLHHLELLGKMERRNALAFMDFYMGEARRLGLKVLIDTAGSPEWMTTIAGRYKDVIKAVELENEVLIPGVKPGDAERWTAQYKAIKQVAPDTQVFLTGNCDQGVFERIRNLGVPFDRVGVHYYKHGPLSKESIPSVAMAAVGHARELGREVTVGEFNWKKLTEYAPEVRAKEMAEIYTRMLSPRAIPELFQFHFQETMSVNPRLTRQGIRHYETIHLDRRPKLEGLEFMDLIRKYARPDAPIRELPIAPAEAVAYSNHVRLPFMLENQSSRPLSIKLAAEGFGDIACKLASKSAISLKPGAKAGALVDVNFGPGAKPGAYHVFVRAEYNGKVGYGWGIVSKPGAPQFDPNPVLPELVEYRKSEMTFDWSRPLCVAYGKGAPILEMEMAYQVFNTLQSAIGRKIRLCSTEDIPQELLEKGNLILVGTPATNPLIAKTSPQIPNGKGLVAVQKSDSNRQWILLTGENLDAVEAAATDFTLRYWKNAKDSSIRITGMEKGAKLGNATAPGDVNLP